MDIQKLKGLIHFFYKSGHFPHTEEKGTNTVCNQLQLVSSEHRFLVNHCIDEIGPHSIVTVSLKNSEIAPYIPSVTDLEMRNRLLKVGGYCTQIEVIIYGQVFQFQGIAISKRDSISLAHLCSVACIQKINERLKEE